MVVIYTTTNKFLTIKLVGHRKLGKIKCKFLNGQLLVSHQLSLAM